MELTTERLKVEIAEPGTVYKGSRFDWTGIVPQVVLDGRHTFCAVEGVSPDKPGTGGIGLCGEFGIHAPVGFDEAAVDGLFPKFGVGLLIRPDDEPYNFFRPYEVQPFKTAVRREGIDKAVFTQAPRECNGYAALYEKVITVAGAVMRIESRLENSGRKPIITTEYNHNFMAIDGKTVGPDYLLSFNFTLKCDDKPDILAFSGSEIKWNATPHEGAFYCRPFGYGSDPVEFELIHKPSGVGVNVASDFSTRLVALWGMSHVVSPEVFLDVAVAPGETLDWSRTYAFING